MVSPSPWPIYTAFSAFLTVLGLILWIHGYTKLPLLCGLLCLTSAFYFWFHDVVEEGVYGGYHTSIVSDSLRTGFILFLVSEVMFFFAFFWVLFHFSLTAPLAGGGIWPTQGALVYLLNECINSQPSYENDWIKAQIPFFTGVEYNAYPLFYDRTDFFATGEALDTVKLNTPKLEKDLTKDQFVELMDSTPGSWENSHFCVNLFSHGLLINPYGIPLLNTAILITSGFILTLGHSLLKKEWFGEVSKAMWVTILFGLLFIILQRSEYKWCGFSINDGIYGSIFYLLTGFHGFHVLVGTIFLLVTCFRVRASHFTSLNHLGFEAAAWYWHFVDVIWILLYLLLYVWPNHRYFFGENFWIEFDFSGLENFYLCINLSLECFNKYFNTTGVAIPADVNLEYWPSLKLAIYKDILASLTDNNGDNLRLLQKYILENKNILLEKPSKIPLRTSANSPIPVPTPYSDLLKSLKAYV